MTVALDDLVELEFAEGTFHSPAPQIHLGGAVVLDDLLDLEFAAASFYTPGAGFYSPHTVDLTDLDEEIFAEGQFYHHSPHVVSGQSILQYLELIPTVLPMQAGDTGFEIDIDFNATPYLDVEAILDILTYTGDIRLALEDGAGTLEVHQNDLARDAGLETALLISLFTDRRATAEQLRAAGMDESDPRGWWGDEDEDEPIGSLIWLLGRATLTNETLAQFRAYALEAWEWLIRDQVAESIACTVERADLEGILITPSVKRPGAADSIDFRWYYNWQAQQVRRA